MVGLSVNLVLKWLPVFLRERAVFCMTEFLFLLTFQISASSSREVPLFRQKPSAYQRTVGRMTKESTPRVLGHSLLHSLVGSHRSFIRSLRTARFARVFRCAHSLAPRLMGKWFLSMKCVDYIPFIHIVQSHFLR